MLPTPRGGTWAIDSARSTRARATTAPPASRTANASTSATCASKHSARSTKPTARIGLLLAEPGLPRAIAAAAAADSARAIRNRRRALAAGLRENLGRARAALERDLDALNETLPPLEEFVLPGGNRAAAVCHVARTVCRRAERQAWAAAKEHTVNARFAALSQPAVGSAVRDGARARSPRRRPRGPLEPRPVARRASVSLRAPRAGAADAASRTTGPGSVLRPGAMSLWPDDLAPRARLGYARRRARITLRESLAYCAGS